MELLTHWKAPMNPDYIGSWSFQPGEVKTLTIARTSHEVLKDTKGRDDDCLILHWKENEKPMVCNPTNAKTIEKLTGTPYLENWIGQKIKLHVEKVRGYEGDMVDGIRVMDQKVAEKITLKPNTAPWKRAVEKLRSGEITLDTLKERVNISPKAVSALIKEVEKDVD